MQGNINGWYNLPCVAYFAFFLAYFPQRQIKQQFIWLLKINKSLPVTWKYWMINYEKLTSIYYKA